MTNYRISMNKESRTMAACSNKTIAYRAWLVTFFLLLLAANVMQQTSADRSHHPQRDRSRNNYFLSTSDKRSRRQTNSRNPILASAYVPDSLGIAKQSSRGGQRSRRCSKKCKCYPNHEARCSFRLLKTIPSGLPSDLQRLNLAYNKFTILPPNSFSEVALSLKFLFLQSNAIHSLPGSFSHLAKVEVLRLSWNKLAAVRKMTFSDLISLKRLYLDNNRLTFIHPESLRGLTNLKLLQLEGNQLSQVHRDTFVTLRFKQYFSFSHIQYLYLSNNQFRVLPQSLFSGISSLRHVYFHGNPWECSCHLQWLHQWMRESGKYRCKQSVLKRGAPPNCAVCADPALMQGEVVTHVSHDSMTCSLPRLIGRDDATSTVAFPDDPSLMEIRNEEMLFQYGAKLRPSFTLRMDGRTGSLVLMHCNATHEPVTSVTANNDVTVTYIGNLELVMHCMVEYPREQNRLEQIFHPYLNSALSFATHNKQNLDNGSVVSYTVKLQNEPLTALPSPGLRLESAALLNSFDVFKTERSTMTLFGHQFRPEEGTLDLLFQAAVPYRLNNGSRKRDFPWTKAVEPSSLKMKTFIAMEGQMGMLKCRAIGFPKPRLSWILTNGALLRPMRHLKRFKLNRIGRLIIQNVDLKDDGIYRCLSQSYPSRGEEWKDISEAIGAVRLVVIPNLKGKISSNVDHVTINEGADWSSSCAAQGVPSPVVAWATPDNQLIFLGKRNVAAGISINQNGSILIENTKRVQQGLYRCFAANRVGVTSYSVYLNITEAGPPQGTLHADNIIVSSTAAYFLNIPSSTLVGTALMNTGNAAASAKTKLKPSSVTSTTLLVASERSIVDSTATTLQQSQSRSSTTLESATTSSVTTTMMVTSPSESTSKEAVEPTNEEIVESTDEEKIESKNEGIGETTPGIADKMTGTVTEQATIDTGNKTSRKTTSEFTVDTIHKEVEEKTNSTQESTETTHKMSTETNSNVINRTLSVETSVTPLAVLSSEPVTLQKDLNEESLSQFKNDIAASKDDKVSDTSQHAKRSQSVDRKGLSGLRESSTVLDSEANSKNTSTTTSDASSEATSSDKQNVVNNNKEQSDRKISQKDKYSTSDDVKSRPVSSVSPANVLEGRSQGTGRLTGSSGSTNRQRLYVPKRSQRIYRVNHDDSLTIECPMEEESGIVWKYYPRSRSQARRHKGSIIREFNKDSNFPDLVFNNTNTIFISRATSSHNGTFLCRNSRRDLYKAHVLVTWRLPHFTKPHYSGMVVEYGQSLRIPCTARGIPAPNVTWSWSTPETLATGIPTTRVYTDPNNVLHVDNITPMYGMTYTCVASNAFGGVTHHVALRVSSSPPTIGSHDTSISSTLGSPATLDCEAIGLPSPTHEWVLPSGAKHDSTNIDSSDMMILPNGSLVIHSLTQNDDGTYKCKVSNPLGEDNINILLDVLQDPMTNQRREAAITEPPAIETEMELTTTSTKATTTTSTKATTTTLTKATTTTSTKAATTTSTKATTTTSAKAETTTSTKAETTTSTKAETTTSTKAATTTSTKATTTTSAKAATTTSTKAAITAELPAHNNQQPDNLMKKTSKIESSGKETIEIPDQDQEKEEKKKFVRDYRVNKYVMHDRTVYMNCRTHFPLDPTLPQPKSRRLLSRGYRNPFIAKRWTTPSGESAAFPTPIPSWRHRVYINGTLRIANVMMRDRGEYTCIAEDSHRRKIRTTVNLVINTELPALDQVAHDYVRVNSGRPAWAPCTASGYPKPRITWTAPNGRTYGPGAYGTGLRVQSSGRLLVYSVDEKSAGTYTCTAANVAGSVTRVVLFKVRSFAPRIRAIRSITQHVRVGGSVKLTCPVVGVPKPYQYWTLPRGKSISMNEGIFESGYSRSKLAMLPTGALMLKRATRKDAGYYHCHASNRMGSDTKTVNLKVYR